MTAISPFIKDGHNAADRAVADEGASIRAWQEVDAGTWQNVAFRVPVLSCAEPTHKRTPQKSNKTGSGKMPKSVRKHVRDLPTQEAQDAFRRAWYARRSKLSR